MNGDYNFCNYSQFFANYSFQQATVSQYLERETSFKGGTPATNEQACLK